MLNNYPTMGYLLNAILSYANYLVSVADIAKPATNLPHSHITSDMKNLLSEAARTVCAAADPANWTGYRFCNVGATASGARATLGFEFKTDEGVRLALQFDYSLRLSPTGQTVPGSWTYAAGYRAKSISLKGNCKDRDYEFMRTSHVTQDSDKTILENLNAVADSLGISRSSLDARFATARHNLSTTLFSLLGLVSEATVADAEAEGAVQYGSALETIDDRFNEAWRPFRDAMLALNSVAYDVRREAKRNDKVRHDGLNVEGLTISEIEAIDADLEND